MLLKINEDSYGCVEHVKCAAKLGGGDMDLASEGTVAKTQEKRERERENDEYFSLNHCPSSTDVGIKKFMPELLSRYAVRPAGSLGPLSFR